MSANRHRAERVAAALADAMADGDDAQTAFRDMLTDMRHYADAHGLAFHDELDRSYGHYLQELQD